MSTRTITADDLTGAEIATGDEGKLVITVNGESSPEWDASPATIAAFKQLVTTGDLAGFILATRGYVARQLQQDSEVVRKWATDMVAAGRREEFNLPASIPQRGRLATEISAAYRLAHR